MNKIIYVQSNEEIAMGFQERFLENEIQMIVAKTGEEALEKIENEEVLLLLIDINIPDMRLRKLVDRIRAKHPQVILNVCVDVLDPLMITKLSNRHHIHKIYVAPWNVTEIIEEVKESLEIALINEQINVKEEEVTSEKQELQDTLESLKKKLKKQQHSYTKLSTLMECFAEALTKSDDSTIDSIEKLAFSKDVYSALLRMQTTGSFDIDRFEEDIKQELREIKGIALGFTIGEIVNCLFGEQSRAKAQNIRFGIFLIARLYAQFFDSFKLSVSSHYITTKEAEFSITIELPPGSNPDIEKIHEDYFKYASDIIESMTEDFRKKTTDSTITYYLVFSVDRE